MPNGGSCVHYSSNALCNWRGFDNLGNITRTFPSLRTLRTFARKFSNINFFLRILPLKVDELVMSEM